MSAGYSYSNTSDRRDSDRGNRGDRGDADGGEGGDEEEEEEPRTLDFDSDIAMLRSRWIDETQQVSD